MRSGSTLLAHILGGHSRLRSFSDLSSFLALARLASGLGPRGDICVKPVDLVYRYGWPDAGRHFDRRVWITRDPRDSYLSSLESGYAYWFQRPGPWEEGLDVGLLERWRQVHRCYLEAPGRWHLVRYEELVSRPEPVLRDLLGYLGLPYERLYPFPRFSLLHGGDYKLRRARTVQAGSRGRHRRELSDAQQAVFQRRLGAEMDALGYPEPAVESGWRLAAG